MKRAENKDIARLMFASVTRPINAALAGAGTLFAVAGMHQPTLEFVGLAMLLGTVASMGRDLSDRIFIDNVLNPGQQPKALPEIPESLAGQYRLNCLEAKRHLDKTIESIDAAGPEVAAELLPIREDIMEHVGSVYRLAEKAHHIDASLTATSRNEINKEIEKLRAQLVLISDPKIRRNLELAREQKEEQLSGYDELALHVKRIQAQMQFINATLDNVHLKVMKIVSDGKMAGAEDVTHTLHSLLEEVRSFERSLDWSESEDPRLAPPGSLEAWDQRAEMRSSLNPGQPEQQEALAAESSEVTPTQRTSTGAPRGPESPRSPASPLS